MYACILSDVYIQIGLYTRKWHSCDTSTIWILIFHLAVWHRIGVKSAFRHSGPWNSKELRVRGFLWNCYKTLSTIYALLQPVAGKLKIRVQGARNSIWLAAIRTLNICSWIGILFPLGCWICWVLLKWEPPSTFHRYATLTVVYFIQLLRLYSCNEFI